MISHVLFTNDCPVCSCSFCLFVSLPLLPFLRNIFFSVIIGFAEQQHHHQTNHWFLSAYILTIHPCLFWVAVFHSEVRELPLLWRRKKKPSWIMLKFHKNETGEAQRRLCPLPGECMSQDPFCQTRGTIPRPGYTGLIQGYFFSLALFWRFTKPDKGHQI